MPIRRHPERALPDRTGLYAVLDAGWVATLAVADGDGPAAEAALHRLGEHLMPGRAAEVRSATRKEYAATLVLRLPVTDGGWTAKARSGPPSPEPEADPAVWTGVLPVRTVLGEPVPTADCQARGIPAPASVTRRLGAWR